MGRELFNEDVLGMLLAVVVLCVCFYIFARSRFLWSINQARRNGLYPPKGKATMFDVRSLIIKSEKDLAIRLYCEIFNSSAREAKKAVEEIEKSIQAKKLEAQ